MDSKWITVIILVTLMLLSGYVYLYVQISRYDQVDVSPAPQEVGIVLGAALWDDELSPSLRERCEYAANLYQRGLVKHLILAGGLGNDKLTEAEAMKKFLLQQGIPADRMILEDQSTSTWENLKNSQRLLQKRRWTKVMLITHDYHQLRALRFAHMLHIDAQPASVHTRVLFMPYHKTRECLALIKQYLFKI